MSCQVMSLRQHSSSCSRIKVLSETVVKALCTYLPVTGIKKMDNTLSQCRLQDLEKKEKKEHIVADVTGVVTVSLNACRAGNYLVGLPLPGNNDAGLKTQKKDPSHLRPCSSCCSLGQPCLWLQLNAQFINILYLPISIPRLALIPGKTITFTRREKAPVYQTCMFLDRE